MYKKFSLKIFSARLWPLCLKGNFQLWIYASIATLYSNTSGIRLTKVYDVTIPRYRKSQWKIKASEMHILPCMVSKLCEISHNIFNLYAAKYAFYEVLKIDNQWNLGVMTF